MRARPSLLAAALLACAACGGTLDFEPVALPPRTVGPRPLWSVQMLQGPPENHPFVTVGHFDEHGYPPTDTIHTILQRIRTRAAREGCDAVIPDASFNEPPPSEPSHPAPDVAGPPEEKHYRADCIVYQPR